MEFSFLEIFKPKPDKALGNLLCPTLLQQRSWPRKSQEVPSSLNHPVIRHPDLLFLRHNLRINRNEAQESLELSYSSDHPQGFHCRSTRTEQWSGELPAQERSPWPDAG